MDSRWARVARGWATAIFATAVAGVSHTLAGGPAPTIFALAVSMIIAATACTILAGRTLSFGRQTLSVAATQVLFHALFSGLGMPVAIAHQHTPNILELSPGPGHTSAMWAAHITAGLITLATLRYAEAAFWGLARTAALLCARLLSWIVAVPVDGGRPRLGPMAPIAGRSELARRSHLRYRGPPATACAF